MARGMKFRIKEVEGVYYLCSENKGADQLRGYRKADLRLCFRIYKNPVFSMRGSYDVAVIQWITSCHKYCSCIPDEKIQVNTRFWSGSEILV